jgi:hypothetical protein
MECPITLEPFTPDAEVTLLLGCNHIFHRNSINNWFQNNVRCPVCRYDIRNYVGVPPREETTTEVPREENYGLNVNNVSNVSNVNNVSNNENHDASFNRRVAGETVNDFATITDAILNQLFQGTNENLVFNENTRYYLDACNNDLIFEGFFPNN